MAPVPRVAGWWTGRSDPQRIALYTRWSYYAALALTPFFAFLVVASSPGPPLFAAVLFLLGSVALTVTLLLLVRAGLRATGPDKRLPTRLLVGAAAAALATVAAGVAAFPDGGEAGSGVAGGVFPAPPMLLIASSGGWPAGDPGGGGGGARGGVG